MTEPTTDHAGAGELLSLEEAAAALGITVNAVRQRIKRHTIAAVRTDQGWLVDLVATNQRPTMSRPTNQPTDQRPQEAAMPHQVDLSPLAEVIEAQTRQISELSAAVGMWQARAHHLEEQLKQLTATVEAAGSPESHEQRDEDARVAAEETAAPGARGDLLERLSRWLRGK